MALIVQTFDANDLLRSIYVAIEKRAIETWECDKDRDFTHSPEQWRNKAWLHPNISGGQLRFGLVGQKDVVMTKVIYAVYHGRFAEMLLTHFDDKIRSISITANKEAPDNFQARAT